MDSLNSAHISVEDDVLLIELEVPPASIGNQIFWLVLLFIPMGALIQILYLWWNTPRAYLSWLIAAGLLALIAWYFLRLLIWSRGGGEIVGIGRQKVLHYSKYKLFNLWKKSRSYGQLEISFYNIDTIDGGLGDTDLLDDMASEGGRGLLFIELDGSRKIETSVDIPYADFVRISQAVDDYFVE